jgi:hypothetical protein
MLLPRLLQAPESFQHEQRAAIVRTWTVEGQRFARAGQLALAIDAFQQALAIDADADEPRRGLTSLTSRNRRIRRLRRLGAVAAALAGLAAGGWLLSRRAAPQTAGPAVVTSTARPAVPSAPVAAVGPPGDRAVPLAGAASAAAAVALGGDASAVAAGAGAGVGSGAGVGPGAQAAVGPAAVTLAAAVTPAAAMVAVKSPAASRASGRSRAALARTGRPATRATPLHEPPPTAPKIKVQLSCSPANVDLAFGEQVASGVLYVALTPGHYHFTCDFAEGRQRRNFEVKRSLESAATVPQFKLLRSLPK